MKPLLYVITALLAVAIVIIIVLVNRSHNEQDSVPLETVSETSPETRTELTAPAAPNNLTAEPISTSIVNLYWTDNSDNEDGFRLYRDGVLIKNLSINTNTYQDVNLEQSTTYQYRVTAFNQIDEATTQIITVRTPNPPITVMLNKIGVYDNGEDFIRDNDGGEVYIGIIITDGNTTMELKLPEADGQFFTLYDEDIVDVETIIYSTEEVGNYLRIAILGYESDGGKGETLLYEALSTAAKLYLGGVRATILGIDTGLDNLIGRLFGAEDDYLGSYEEAWKADNGWGTGIYNDIPCYMEDSSVGLRLWFTIEMD